MGAKVIWTLELDKKKWFPGIACLPVSLSRKAEMISGRLGMRVRKGSVDYYINKHPRLREIVKNEFEKKQEKLESQRTQRKAQELRCASSLVFLARFDRALHDALEYPFTCLRGFWSAYAVYRQYHYGKAQYPLAIERDAGVNADTVYKCLKLRRYTCIDGRKIGRKNRKFTDDEKDRIISLYRQCTYREAAGILSKSITGITMHQVRTVWKKYENNHPR